MALSASIRFALRCGVLTLAVAGLVSVNGASVIDDARKALAEKIPEVAIQKLTTRLAAPDLPSGERPAAVHLLAEAQIAAGSYAEALVTLEPEKDATDSTAMLLLAHAYAGQNRWAEALPLYEKLGARPGLELVGMLGEAEALQAQGRTGEAVQVLERLTEADGSKAAVKLRMAGLLVELGRVKEAREVVAGLPASGPDDEQWRRYLEARFLLHDKNYSAALAVFEQLLKKPEHLSENLLVASTLGAAETQLALQGPESADTALETFISQHPDCTHLDLIFRRLDQLYALEKNPGEGELHRMSKQLPAPGAALAQFYVIRLQLREKRYDRAEPSTRNFLKRFADHPLAPLVYAMRAEIALEKPDLAEAERAYVAAVRAAGDEDQRGLRAEMELRTGLLYFRQGEFLLAEKFFRSAGTDSPRLKQSAAFNTALSWLKQKNPDRFHAELKAFSAEFPDSPLRGDLVLEEGLLLAREGEVSAPRALQTFLKEFPAHPRRSEARVAQAELAFLSGDLAQPGVLLKTAAGDSPSPEMSDQSEYLAIFIEDAKQPRDEEKVIELARAFVRERPKSPLLAEVRMKLGQVYFQRQDFPNAQSQFETLALEQVKGGYVEAALFLAGQCATRLMSNEGLNRAVELFEQVAALDGPLKVHARLQEAIISHKLGKEQDAVKLYDEILARNPPAEPEVRFAALCGKGDNLGALGIEDPKRLEDAAAAYERLAAQPDVTPTWRNQALYKKAKALEQLGRQPEAQAVFYDVLERSLTGPRETFWYYKAGFDAARGFEAQQQWRSAIGIYEKMSKLPGPRAEEAQARIKGLRLKHFLWD